MVDSKSMKVYGYIDLIAIREITPQEYASWDCIGKWSGMMFQVDESKKYYAWDMKNPRREDNLFNVINKIIYTLVVLLSC